MNDENVQDDMVDEGVEYTTNLKVSDKNIKQEMQKTIHGLTIDLQSLLRDIVDHVGGRLEWVHYPCINEMKKGARVYLNSICLGLDGLEQFDHLEMLIQRTVASFRVTIKNEDYALPEDVINNNHSSTDSREANEILAEIRGRSKNPTPSDVKVESVRGLSLEQIRSKLSSKTKEVSAAEASLQYLLTEVERSNTEFKNIHTEVVKVKSAEDAYDEAMKIL